MMGIVSSVLNMISPVGKMKNHLGSLIGIAVLVSIISGFSTDGFRLTLREIELSSEIDHKINNTSSDVSEIFLEEAEDRFDEYFIDLLNKNDISGAKVNTNLQLNDENELDIVEVMVAVADISQVSHAEKIISDEIGGEYVRVGLIEDNEASMVGE